MTMGRECRAIPVSVCWLAIGSCVLAAAGCGGGGTGGPGSAQTTPGGGSERTVHLGPMTTRFVSNSPLTPVTAAGISAEVTGLAGGSFQSLILNDTSPSLAETRILFAASRSRAGTGYYSMNTDGSGALRLLTVPSFNGNEPIFAWSPDGSRFAYYLPDGNLYTANADGTGQTAVTTGGNNDTSPSWSPDGTKIAFTRAYQIYVTNADGSGSPTALTSGNFDDDPSWSAATSTRSGRLTAA